MSKKIVFVLSLFVLALAACAPRAAGSGDLPAAVQEAQAWLAERLGVAVEDVVVLESEEVDWRDGCLELGGPAESCLAAITPGWLVSFEVDGETYVVHTDADGSQIRLNENPGS
jgi:hypothetical protein